VNISKPKLRSEKFDNNNNNNNNFGTVVSISRRQRRLQELWIYPLTGLPVEKFDIELQYDTLLPALTLSRISWKSK